MVQTIHVNLNMLSYFDSAKGQVLLVGLICLWYVPLDSQCSPHEYFKDRGGDTAFMFFLPSLDRLFAASFRRLIVLMHVCSRCRARTVAPESTMQLQQWRSVPHSIVSNFILRSKIYIHPIYLSHIHTRASFRTTAAAATAKPAYRGCIAPLPDPNTLYKMWITIINYIHIFVFGK